MIAMRRMQNPVLVAFGTFCAPRIYGTNLPLAGSNRYPNSLGYHFFLKGDEK